MVVERLFLFFCSSNRGAVAEGTEATFLHTSVVALLCYQYLQEAVCAEPEHLFFGTIRSAFHVPNTRGLRKRPKHCCSYCPRTTPFRFCKKLIWCFHFVLSIQMCAFVFRSFSSFPLLPGTTLAGPGFPCMQQTCRKGSNLA